MSKRTSYDEQELQQLVHRALSRRDFLGRTALAAGTVAFGSAFLTACAKKEGAAAGADSAAAAAPAPPSRRCGSPTGRSISTRRRSASSRRRPASRPNTPRTSTTTTSSSPRSTSRSSAGQSIDRDVIVLTDWMAGRLIQLGYVQAIPDAPFPNKANLVDGLRDVGFDPGRKFSVPWLSGMTGIGYNPKKTGRELTSINDIFDPKFKGKVTMLTEMRDTLGLVMLGQGKDPDHLHPRGCQGGLRQDQEVPRERTHPEVHRQRLRRRSRGRQYRRGHRLVGRHPGPRGGQPGPPLDRAEGRRHALLRQHDDPQDQRPRRIWPSPG